MKKQTMKKRATKKTTAKRELITPRGDKRYIRRDAKGRIKESDDVSRSLSQDRRRKAKATTKAGAGRPGRSQTRESLRPEKDECPQVTRRSISSAKPTFRKA